MDKFRVVLIAGLVMASLMLVIEYAKFNDNISKQQLLNQQQQAASQLPKEAFPNLQASMQASEEIPSAPVATEENSPEAKPASTDLITVTTDNLVLQINPKGGDIVFASLNQHLSRIDTPEIPFVILENSDSHTYTAQSGLIGKNGTDLSIEDRPLFHVAQQHFSLGQDEQQLVVDLHYQQGKTQLTKRFTFKRGDYLIGVQYLINNQSNEAWQAALYGQIRHDGLKKESTHYMGLQPYLGFATTTADERFKKIDFDDAAKKSFSATTQGGWIALLQHYFVSAWIPEQTTNNEYSTLKTSAGHYLARFKTPLVTVDAGQSGEINAQFYVGPKDQYRLAKIAPSLDLSVDYGWLWMVAQPLYAILYLINNGSLHIFGKVFDMFGGVGNWGISIILLTILVKLVFFSLNAKAYRSMGKMRALQPKMLEIRERYADDRQKQSQEMMALYSKEKVNPLGGCLPILVQMPVFIALYWVLLESVELRHAPFVGYIKDLSAMDPYFILPLFMGVTMWFQQKLNPAPTDPMQAKIMQFLPIIFTFFFLFFPAGLVLYWVVNNVLSIAQQWVITRAIERETNGK